MKNKTRNALILSVLSLALCFTMLIGTTYAWFTDSVSSGTNKIVAGNLDVGLQYYNGTAWADVTSSVKLFDDDARWEPGHTEVAYLKITNLGTLALKYQLAVNVANEVSGTNVNDATFKLSDYIKMGVLEGQEPSFANREDAIAAVASTAANITTAVKAGTLSAGAEPKYVALVVYMPDTVGNDANYKTGTTAPSIDLGVTLVATQLTEEADSFNDQYDASATQPVVASANVVDGTDTTLTAGTVTVTVPDAVTDAASATALTLEVNNYNDDVLDGEVSMNIELLDQSGAKVTSSTDPITVNVNIGTGKTVTAVRHNGTPVTSYTYNAATGILTFTTTSFSPFSIEYATLVATAAELSAALEAGGKILLTADITGDRFTVVKDTTIDGNGHTISDNIAGRAIWIDVPGVVLNLKNLTIDGQNVCERGVQVNNGSEGNFYTATITIDNCIIKNMKTYAINFCSYTTVDLTVTNSTVSGWAAINAYGTGNVITVNNSILEGKNTYSGTSNAFCTICLEGDTTGTTTMHSADYTITVNNSTIKASRTGDQSQSILGFNPHAENSTVAFNNCTFKVGEGCYFGYDCGSTEYPNTLIIDGETVTMPHNAYFTINND